MPLHSHNSMLSSMFGFIHHFIHFSSWAFSSLNAMSGLQEIQNYCDTQLSSRKKIKQGENVTWHNDAVLYWVIVVINVCSLEKFSS